MTTPADAACTAKVKLTAAKAKKAAKRAARRWETRMAPYRCSHCHWWHVGEHDIDGRLLQRRPRTEPLME